MTAAVFQIEIAKLAPSSASPDMRLRDMITTQIQETGGQVPIVVRPATVPDHWIVVADRGGRNDATVAARRALGFKTVLATIESAS